MILEDPRESNFARAHLPNSLHQLSMLIRRLALKLDRIQEHISYTL